jgi:hypothetical protein
VSGDPPFPIRVGNEFEVVESQERSQTVMGETTTETVTSTETYRVEEIEDVTVPAGTFECYRAVRYDNSGSPVATSWYSDEVRWFVKETDHESGAETVLVSYSLS